MKKSIILLVLLLGCKTHKQVIKSETAQAEVVKKKDTLSIHSFDSSLKMSAINQTYQTHETKEETKEPVAVNKSLTIPGKWEAMKDSVNWFIDSSNPERTMQLSTSGDNIIAVLHDNEKTQVIVSGGVYYKVTKKSNKTTSGTKDSAVREQKHTGLVKDSSHSEALVNATKTKSEEKIIDRKVSPFNWLYIGLALALFVLVLWVVIKKTTILTYLKTKLYAIFK